MLDREVDEMRLRSELRILNTGYLQMHNLIKLERYGEAEKRARVLGGILHTWQKEKINQYHDR